MAYCTFPSPSTPSALVVIAPSPHGEKDPAAVFPFRCDRGFESRVSSPEPRGASVSKAQGVCQTSRSHHMAPAVRETFCPCRNENERRLKVLSERKEKCYRASASLCRAPDPLL
ncbi:hypothetical protein EYF80_060346 [Liparis tanakae]|uniref:Uncharacterized protein n=1 Tax=Liparis tanakae TaxID=230148 RepID=A0A4Z2EL69_9TELE|nr:hypothetical protein EYF80_060346 [Liparis tanakae]